MLLIIFIILMIFSIFVHEYGHMFAAKRYGWEYQGFKIKWFGPAVKMLGPEDKIKNLWKIALAGPAATFLLAFIFLMLSPLAGIFLIMFYFNIFSVVLNLIPLPKTDGLAIWCSLRGDIDRFRVHSQHPND